MKKSCLLYTILVFFFWSCGTNEEELCEDFLLSIDNEIIEGTIRVCNATPPMQETIASEAIVMIVGDSIKFDLRTLDNTFDTTLVFKYDCVVHEKTIPALNLSNKEKEGYVNHLESFLLQFSFVCEFDSFTSF